MLRNKRECEFACAGVCSLGLAELARRRIFHPDSPQAPQRCGFCRDKWSLVTVRQDYYNLIIGLAPMVHSVPLGDEKERSPHPLETAIQTRREKTGNPQCRKWKRLQKLRAVCPCILMMMKWQQLSQQRAKFVDFGEAKEFSRKAHL